MVAVLICGTTLAQKDQDADTLRWGTEKYLVYVDRVVPSVVHSYYYRSGDACPFNFWSNSNNRGHTASFVVNNSKLYVAAIHAKRFKTRKGNLWTESGIDTSAAPTYFGVRSLDTSIQYVSDTLFADWFSGVLELTSFKVNSGGNIVVVSQNRLLVVKDGNVVGDVEVTPAQRKAIADGDKGALLETQRETLELQEYYRCFYLRCAQDREGVSFQGHRGLFEIKRCGLTLVMSLFDNNPDALRAISDEGFSPDPPFGEWIIRNDSLLLLPRIVIHSGKGLYNFDTSSCLAVRFLPASDSSYHFLFSSDGYCFANWIDGEYAIHYGIWDTNGFGVPDFAVEKTQRITIENGIVVSSDFSPSSFADDSLPENSDTFSFCNPAAVFSVVDNQLESVVGKCKKPKTSPAYDGGIEDVRLFLLAHPLTDSRASDRLFRVRIGFAVNCKGEVGQWQILNKNRGELNEFACMVLETVKTMPQKWSPATDKKGNAVDCWQILELTVSSGTLINPSYK